MKLGYLCFFFLVAFACKSPNPTTIDRKALADRNSPIATEFDELSSFSVGNGDFAFTVDATGLQSFPEIYTAGVPLGTQSQWGWHSFPNPNKYRQEETLMNYNFRGREEPYSVQIKDPGHQQSAADWLRANPHRMHLGYIGLDLTHADGSKIPVSELSQIKQTLKLWDGQIFSRFNIGADSVAVQTACDPERDMVAASVSSELIEKQQLKIKLKFPYPTGEHTDDASNWAVPEKHKTEIVAVGANSCVIKRTLDSTVYYVTLHWVGGATVTEREPHYILLTPRSNNFSFTCEFSEKPVIGTFILPQTVFTNAIAYWEKFWKTGGAVDFSNCKAPQAKELERRVELSQYLMAIQCAGDLPPQETGLTYNSWYGKFHLEMHWWHAVHFALWNRCDLLERSLDWYTKAYPKAKSIAERQGFDGARWMKMTDPSANEAPSSIGSFLIWQQPHFIYMAELIYRNHPSTEVIKKYGFLVEETAKFMASFVDYDKEHDRYILKGIIPAQETLLASETINPPFELSYWHYGLSVAQKWRERAGLKRNEKWDEIIAKLSPLASANGLYLASEDATDTYKDIRFTSDHPAVLGALGVFPQCRLVNREIMKNTLHWVWDKWNWDVTWGWDYPMTAMCAARVGEPEKAVGALLMDKLTNTYLANGHNYQNSQLRIYLPGNGGLLTAVAMMCAGWDGSESSNPGFPKDGNWNVVWEGLSPIP